MWGLEAAPLDLGDQGNATGGFTGQWATNLPRVMTHLLDPLEKMSIELKICYVELI